MKGRCSHPSFNSKLKKKGESVHPFPKEKIAIILRCERLKRTLSDIKLIRTDTTFDLSQKAEKN